jgi:hypothetical protein
MVIDGEACFRVAIHHVGMMAMPQASLSRRWFDASRRLPRDRPVAKRAREFLWPLGVADPFVVPD